MRIRTIMSNLGCTGHAVAAEQLLDREVFAVVDAPTEAPEGWGHLIRLADGRSVHDFSHLVRQGCVTLAFCGDDLPQAEVPDGVVLACAPVSWEEFGGRFAAMPVRIAQLEERRALLMRAFQGSYDLDRLTEGFAEVIGNPVLIVNTDGRILARGGSFSGDQPNDSEDLSTRYISSDVLNQLEEDGIAPAARSTRRTILGSNERFGQRWGICILRRRGLELGHLAVQELHSRIEPADLELIDYAAGLLGIVVEHLGAAGNAAGSGSSVLHDVLCGGFPDEETMRSRLAGAQVSYHGRYVIMLVRAAEVTDGADYRSHLASLLCRCFRKTLWTDVEGQFALLVELEGEGQADDGGYALAQRALLGNEEFMRTVRSNSLQCFVAEPFEDMGLGAGRFRQCVLLGDALRGSMACDFVSLFWRRRFDVLAKLARGNELADVLLDKRLASMVRYDDRHGTAYFETAVASVRHPGSPTDAAQALCVHRNTYFYRVSKMLDLFGVDLKYGDDRLSVALAAHLMNR